MILNSKIDFKTYYKFEKGAGYAGDLVKDTPDQDMDKTRTYDHCRIEYSHLDSILFIDTDEVLFCPEAGSGIENQVCIIYTYICIYILEN